MIKRRISRKIKVGKVAIGGNAPIAIQSMANTETADIKNTIAQVTRLEGAGCEIIRLAVKNLYDADAIKPIKRKVKIPVVADIHFDYRLALQAIKNGADKIRLNPGNLKDASEIKAVVSAAKDAHIPIRIGVNSGSINSDAVKAALKFIKLFEGMHFHDIIISLKSSDVVATIESYREISRLCDYPLHLGVTATGPYNTGIVKSSIGIGALLAEGIGDTIRVSLTADPVEEIKAARKILSSINLRRFGPEIISCPTCGRCKVDLIGIVNRLEKELSAFGPRFSAKKPITIAVMGCEVNGPGEAREADIGIAAGKGAGALFIKGKIVKRVEEKDFIKEILKNIKK